MNVAILTYNDCAFFELGCAIELFGLPRPEFPNWYHADVVCFDAGPFTATAGVQLQAKQVKSLQRYDMLVIPSWPVAGQKLGEQAIVELLKFYRAGKRILSFCSGAFLLAELGMLDNRKATTHWRYAETFQQRFPYVPYAADVLYVYDGVVGCSAGSAAGLDLGLEVIRQDFGATVANQVARRLVISAHRSGGQAQYVETPVYKAPSAFNQALDWALSHLAEPIDIDRFAAKACLSRRSFDRKFRATFNTSPKSWLTEQRVNLAKQLIEQGRYSLEQVAARTGFENASNMRHHFRSMLSISPSQYALQFAARNTSA